MGRGAVIALGTLAGGLLGAVSRPAVVYAVCMRNADVELSKAVLFGSAGIGLLVGAVAALIAAVPRTALARAVAGILSGAVLAYAFAAVTFLPLFFCGLLGVSGMEFNEAPELYGLGIALSGAMSGGGGALVQAGLRGPSPDRVAAPRP
jgi:hypothetical protein